MRSHRPDGEIRTLTGGKLARFSATSGARLTKEGYQKPVVVGMLDRESRQSRARVIPNLKRETLQKRDFE